MMSLLPPGQSAKTVHSGNGSYSGMQIWSHSTTTIFTWFGFLRLLLLPQDEEAVWYLLQLRYERIVLMWDLWLVCSITSCRRDRAAWLRQGKKSIAGQGTNTWITNSRWVWKRQGSTNCVWILAVARGSIQGFTSETNFLRPIQRTSVSPKYSWRKLSDIHSLTAARHSWMVPIFTILLIEVLGTFLNFCFKLCFFKGYLFFYIYLKWYLCMFLCI